jgi:hypothetical protein
MYRTIYKVVENEVKGKETKGETEKYTKIFVTH